MLAALSLGLGLILVITLILLAKKSPVEGGINSPFECGMPVVGNSRMTFSLQFFIVLLIFLIFDVELALLFPYLLKTVGALSVSEIVYISVVVLILSMGLVVEWRQTMLD